MYRAKKQRKSTVQIWIEDNKPKLPLLGGGLLVLTLYLAGLLNQLTSFSFMSKEKTPISLSVITCIKAAFSGMQGMILMLVLYLSLASYFYLRYRDIGARDLRDDERGFQTDESGIFGSNTLMKEEGIRDFLEVEPLKRTTGLVVGKLDPDEGKSPLSKVISIPPDGMRIKHDATGRALYKRDKITGEKKYQREKLLINANMNTMVVAPSGSGKSFCYALPNIFMRIWNGDSFVVSDPKGELYSLTSEYATANGYTTKILNLAEPSVSDSWDVLGEAQRNATDIDFEIMNISTIIIENTESANGGGDEAHKRGEKNLLKALIMYVVYENPPQKRTLGDVAALLSESDEELNKRFEEAVHETPKRPWSNYIKGSENFRGNLRAGLSDRLETLQSDTIRIITGTPDIDLTLPGRAKCAYYIIMEDMTTTFKFLSSLFFTSLINSLVTYSRKQDDGRLPKRVYFIMDEFAAIGRLPDFDKKIAVVRSAGISMTIIFQTLAQLKVNYPDSWETLVANCSTIICLACGDLTTAEYLSKRSGTASVAQEQSRVNRPYIDIAYVPTNVTYSYSTGKREVLNIGDILTFPPDEELIVVIDADLFFAKKLPLTDIIDRSTLKIANMYNHNPAWRAKQNAEARGIGRASAEIAPYQQQREERAQEQEKTQEPPQEDTQEGVIHRDMDPNQARLAARKPNAGRVKPQQNSLSSNVDKQSQSEMDSF